jgi:hypothetical protein
MFGGVPFDPADPEYGDDEREMFRRADAYDALASLIEKCEEVDWSQSTDWRSRLLAQFAAGFATTAPSTTTPPRRER